MLTGLSLTFCIMSICNGVVKEEDVEKIFTGTLANTREEFVIIVEDYSHSWWAKYPQKAIETALRFWDSGKIEQPRVHDKVPFSYDKGIWMDEKHMVLNYDEKGDLISTGEKVKLANFERWV